MPTEFWCVGGKEAGDLEFETSLPQAKREREYVCACTREHIHRAHTGEHTGSSPDSNLF